MLRAGRVDALHNRDGPPPGVEQDILSQIESSSASNLARIVRPPFKPLKGPPTHNP